MNGMSNLLLTKPGVSLDIVTSFPIAIANSLARVRTSGEVCKAGINSTNVIIGTGLTML